jgi:MOSC domain-containing protein YiiM
VVGDRHHGITRPSSSRELRFYPRGTLIRNRRQVTLVSAEELAEIARRLQVPEVRAEWLGANLLVTGSGELSRLPVGSRLVFSSGVTLVCEGINQPCRLPAQVLHRHYPEARALSRFVPAAMGRRGVVATVEHPGTITRGDGATVTPPEPYASFG